MEKNSKNYKSSKNSTNIKSNKDNKNNKNKKGKSLAVVLNKKPVRKIVEYYYFLTEDVDARMLQKAVGEAWFEKADIWPELNLMEVEMSFDSLIFQDAAECFIDPADMAWFEEQGIRSRYQISYDTGDRDAVQAVMGHIMETLGGRIYSDTDDFEPSFGREQLGELQ